MNRDSVVEDWAAAPRIGEHVLIQVQRLQAPRATPPSKNGLNVADDGDVEVADGGAAEDAAW